MRFRERPNWLDLPQDILKLILGKLNVVDQVRALAVCKYWRDCKDQVRSSDPLPWVVNHKNFMLRMPGLYIPRWELFNPYTQQVHTMSLYGTLSPLVSKQGWLLFCTNENIESKALVLHNPFTNDTRRFPLRNHGENYDIKATIKADPISREFEIFIFVIRGDGFLLMDTYTSSAHSAQTTECIVQLCSHEDEICSALYMNGSIYFLFYSGELCRYCLEDKTWRLLTSQLPEDTSRFFAREYWLLETNDNLFMVFMEVSRCNSIMIFRFDWFKMSWVVETGLQGCAIYISGRAAFSAPLKNRSGEKLKGCKVFYILNDPPGMGIRCYSMSDALGATVQCEEYSWIKEAHSIESSFIEPPYFAI